MKTCAFCECQNPEDAVCCEKCGNEFVSFAPPQAKSIASSEREAFVPETIPTDAAPLCSSCLTPNLPDAVFCKKCGAPIGNIAAVGPWEHTWAEGFIYRKATEGHPKRITVVGVWLIFFPGFLASLFMVAMVLKEGIDGVAPVILSFLSLGLGVVCAVIIVKVTQNYFAEEQKESQERDASEPNPQERADIRDELNVLAERRRQIREANEAEAREREAKAKAPKPERPVNWD